MAVPDQQAPQTHPRVQRVLDAAQTGAAIQAAGQATKTATTAPGIAVSAPAVAAAEIVSTGTEVVAHGIKVAIVLRLLRKLFARHRMESASWLENELRRRFPKLDRAVIRQAVARELAFEAAFQRKAYARVETDMHKAGQLPSPQARAKRAAEILEREKHYGRLREKALLARAIAHCENAITKLASPLGAKWVLGHTKNHTLGCLALAGRNWPWEVLDTIPPPLHTGCGCSLEPLGPGETVPDVGTAMHMARRAIALEEAVRSVADPGEVEAYLEDQPVRPSVARALRRLQEARYEETEHARGRGGRWIKMLGKAKLKVKPTYEEQGGFTGKRLTKTQVRSVVRRVAEGLVDFYGGDKQAVQAHYDQEFTATKGVDAQFRHREEVFPGIIYGQNVADKVREPDMGLYSLRQVAHEAAHSLSGTTPGPLPGFSQHVEEGGAEILSLWFWKHRMQELDHRDAVRAGGKWTAPGDETLAHSVVYRNWVEEFMRRSASKVGWDRAAIMDEVERVMRGDHTVRLNFRDETDPKFELPKDLPEVAKGDHRDDEEGDHAVALMRWLLDADAAKLTSGATEGAGHGAGQAEGGGTAGGGGGRRRGVVGFSEVDVSAPQGRDRYLAGLRANQRAGFISDPGEALAGKRAFLSDDGNAGVTVAASGEVGNLFRNRGAPPGAGSAALDHAVTNGGTWLNCFDGKLPEIYKRSGFVEVARLRWDPAQEPGGWDHARYDAPDVVFMGHGGEPVHPVPAFTDWDAAERAVLEHVKGLQEANIREATSEFHEWLHPRGRGGKWTPKYDHGGALQHPAVNRDLETAQRAIEHAMSRPMMPLKVEKLPDEDSATARSRPGGKIAIQDAESPFQLSAIVHETGHAIDRSRHEDEWLTQAEESGGLRKVLWDSPTTRRIKNDEIDVLKGDPYVRRDILNDRELFARAFEQYVALRGNDERLKAHLRKTQADKYLSFLQWPDAEFEPIAAEMDKLFGRGGELQEASWTEWLHPRGRRGQWVEALRHAEQEVPERHQGFTGEDFAHALDGFEHGGVVAVRSPRTQAKNLYGEVWLNLVKPGASEPVGLARVKLLPPDNRGVRYAELSNIYLHEAEQNNGFGRAFTDHLLKTLADGGVDKIKIQAVSIGGYAWARRGFVWTGDKTAVQRKLLADAKADGRWAQVERHVAAERLAQFEAKIERGEFSSEAELAAEGRDLWWYEEPLPEPREAYGPYVSPPHVRTWLGKQLMIGSRWSGERPVVVAAGALQEAEELELVERAEEMRLVWDPIKHRRGWHGHFAEMLKHLPKPSLRGRGGGKIEMPDGHEVRRTRHGYHVTRPGGGTMEFQTAEEAATDVHDRYESERLRAEVHAERIAATVERQGRQAHEREQHNAEQANRTWYRFETAEDARKIEASGELWGLPSRQGRGVAAVRAQPHRPDDSTVAHERANGRVLVEFHTKIAPDSEHGIPHFAWTPQTTAQKHHAEESGLRAELAHEQEATRYGKIHVAKLKIHGVRILS